MDDIDRLILDWFSWSDDWCAVRSYARADTTCRGFRSSRSWLTPSDQGDSVDMLMRERVARVMDSLVMQLTLKQRIALNTHARNLASDGAMVFQNPRYPQSHRTDLAEAKAALGPGLRKAGLLEREQAPRRGLAHRIA